MKCICYVSVWHKHSSSEHWHCDIGIGTRHTYLFHLTCYYHRSIPYLFPLRPPLLHLFPQPLLLVPIYSTEVYKKRFQHKFQISKKFTHILFHLLMTTSQLEVIGLVFTILMWEFQNNVSCHTTFKPLQQESKKATPTMKKNRPMKSITSASTVIRRDSRSVFVSPKSWEIQPRLAISKFPNPKRFSGGNVRLFYPKQFI